MAESNDDRRTHDRTPLVLKVEYPDREGFLRDYTENISKGGMMLRSQRNLAVGDTIQLLISFPGLLAKILLKGSVRWISTDGDHDDSVGVEFDRKNQRQWDELQSLIKRIEVEDQSVVTSVVVRVLVVEDNLHVARLIRRGLEAQAIRGSEGVAFKVSHASDGAEALGVLSTEQFDLLICDIMVPGIDGVALIKRIRGDRRWDGLPIIAVSGARGDVRARAIDAGADFFLDKPIRLAELLNSMRRLVVSTQNRLPLPV